MSSGPDWQDNRTRAETLIADAASMGAQLVVLPENFCLMPARDEDRLQFIEPFADGPVQTFLSEQSLAHGLWLFGGTVPLRADDRRVYAACLAFSPDGACAARYDKIHLFDVQVGDHESYRESATIAAGDPGQRALCRTPDITVGLSVCYDLRFPELYRRLTADGAQVLIVPSAFTAVTGRAHWEALLRARAIENQAYVLAAGQWGRHASGRQTHGHSMIVDPWGEVLAQRVEGDGIVQAEIDLAALQLLRQRFPCLEHRRL